MGKVKGSASAAHTSFVIERDFAAAGTHMVYTEQLVYLDGHDDRTERMQGTMEGMDRLSQILRESGHLQ